MRIIGLLGVVLLAGCTIGAPTEQPTPVNGSPPAGAPTDAAPTRPPTGTPPVEPVPVEPTLPPIVGEVPSEIMAALIDESAALAQVDYGDVSIQRAEAVTWSDGSLGCPEPDMMYTQALVDGYWVVLEAAGQTYDWRMSEIGLPRLCPEGQGEPPFEGLPD
jgi:hypothetical protein